MGGPRLARVARGDFSHIRDVLHPGPGERFHIEYMNIEYLNTGRFCGMKLLVRRNEKKMSPTPRFALPRSYTGLIRRTTVTVPVRVFRYAALDWDNYDVTRIQNVTLIIDYQTERSAFLMQE